MAITQVITAIPSAGHRGVDVRTTFVQKQEAFQDALTNTTVTELNAFRTQANALEQNVNDKEALALQHTTDAQTAKTQAETARDVAFATANFKGSWNSVTDFGNSSCEYLGLVYVSKVNPNVNHTPTDVNFWTPVTKEINMAIPNLYAQANYGGF